MSIRILLVDDHRIVRDGLRSLLEREPDMEVVAEADNGRTALELAHEKRPTVILMDIAMGELNGIEATRQIAAELPESKVLVLSMHSDRQFVKETLQAGASGFLLKDCPAQELYDAIRAAVSNQTYLSREIAQVVVEHFVRRPSSPNDPSPAPVLTGREREIVQLIAEGWSTRDIASRLCVSVKTIETHRRGIMKKLGIRSIAELTKYAVREGLTSLDK